MNTRDSLFRNTRTAVLAGAAVIGIGSSVIRLSAFTGDHVLGCGDSWQSCQRFGTSAVPCPPADGEGGGWGPCDAYPNVDFCVSGTSCS